MSVHRRRQGKNLRLVVAATQIALSTSNDEPGRSANSGAKREADDVDDSATNGSLSAAINASSSALGGKAVVDDEVLVVVDDDEVLVVELSNERANCKPSTDETMLDLIDGSESKSTALLSDFKKTNN